MKTFHRLNILDDAGSHRAVQQTLFDGSSLEGVSPHLLFLLVRSSLGHYTGTIGPRFLGESSRESPRQVEERMATSVRRIGLVSRIHRRSLVFSLVIKLHRLDS